MKKVLLGLVAIGLISWQNQENSSSQNNEGNQLGFDLANLDSTISPCDDFFLYTSGNWIKNNPIPETESRWGSFNELIESNNKNVKDLLDEIVQKSDFEKGSYQQLVADFYKSGMDSNAVEKAGIQGLKPILAKVSNIQSLDDYLKLNTEFKGLGISHPWSIYVGIDEKNSSRHLLQVSQSGMGMPDRDYYLKSDSSSVEIQEKYRIHLEKMLVLSEYEEDKAKKAAVGIYEFEKLLAKAAMSRVDRRSPEKTYNKMAYKELLEIAPSLKLDYYFKTNNLKFDTAVVKQPDYIKSLDSIISNTSIQVLKDYAHWSVIDAYAAYLSSDFVNQNFDFFNRTLRGSRKLKPRWKRILSSLNAGLGEPLGHMYVDKHFPASSKENIKNMVEDLRAAYKLRIEGLDWMGEETKKKAIEKLEGFTYKIGYPDKWKSFEGLEISPDNFLINVINLNRYGIAENFAKLDKEVDRSEWYMPAHIVNAYYNPANNEVVFPAGILQAPFYNPEAEAALNYGGIGGVIGHEFSHGFDDEGSKYNKDGNLNDWWTVDDRSRFDVKTKALAEQYSSYEPLEGVFVNGKLTLGENIADLGGLTLAYNAYKTSLENGREEVVIDGFTWQQRVFLGWAQVWQTNQTDAYLRNQVTTDPHSPAKYRVNGTVSNMDEFKAAWGCKDEDPMINSGDDQVKIW